MFLNTPVIDTYMENKEVWVVVLVLGFVLLLNSNSFTGNALVPTGDRAALLRGETPSRAVPSGLQTSPANYQYIPRDIIGGAQSSGEKWYGAPRYAYRQGDGDTPITSSPPQYGSLGYGQQPGLLYTQPVGFSQTGGEAVYPSSADPNRPRRYAGEGITPAGYRQTDPTDRNW